MHEELDGFLGGCLSSRNPTHHVIVSSQLAFGHCCRDLMHRLVPLPPIVQVQHIIPLVQHQVQMGVLLVPRVGGHRAIDLELPICIRQCVH